MQISGKIGMTKSPVPTSYADLHFFDTWTSLPGPGQCYNNVVESMPLLSHRLAGLVSTAVLLQATLAQGIVLTLFEQPPRDGIDALPLRPTPHQRPSLRELAWNAEVCDERR